METLTAPNDTAAVASVRPCNDSPAERYDLVVVGSESIARAAALEAARLGARVGWFPGSAEAGTAGRAMKSWIASARAAYTSRSATDYGVNAAEVCVEFHKIQARTARVLAELERSDFCDALRSLGIDVFHGAARFSGPQAVTTGERAVSFRRAILALGTRPAAPTIRGLGEIGFCNRLTVFSMTELPARWIVLGGDGTACELAQTLRRFGCHVHLVTSADTLLPGEELHAAELIQRQFEREGVVLHLGWTPILAERLGGAKAVTIERQSERLKLFGDEILAATGDVPCTADVGLEAAGIHFDERGIAVDDLLRTSNATVFSLGKACASGEAHSDLHARLAARNALVLGRSRTGRWQVPRLIDTDPAIARIGLTRAEAAERNLPVDSFRIELAEVERAALDGETDGYAVVHVARGGDRIVGATIVARDAAALVGELALVMNRRLGLRALSQSPHGELSTADLLRQLSARACPPRLRPSLAGWLKRWFNWRREKAATR